MPGRLALDLETVSPSLGTGERPPDFEDPTHFELLAVALAHETHGGERSTAVLFREGTDPASELDLLERTCEWLAERSARVCLTYNGERFDRPQLEGRARLAAEAAADGAGTALAGRVRRLFETELTHVDLLPPAWAVWGEYTSLEGACRAAGLEPATTRWAAYDHGFDLDALRPPDERGPAALRAGDVPIVGERYLELVAAGAGETATAGALRAMLGDYAREDVAHLFDLADALGAGDPPAG